MRTERESQDEKAIKMPKESVIFFYAMKGAQTTDCVRRAHSIPTIDFSVEAVEVSL